MESAASKVPEPRAEPFGLMATLPYTGSAFVWPMMGVARTQRGVVAGSMVGRPGTGSPSRES